MKDIIQLKITLQGTNPPIWRRVLVEKETSFFMLHYIIQFAMGWDNSHLFEFEVKGTRIGEPEESDGYRGDEVLEASEVILGSMVNDARIKFDYIYDFGDSWEHVIKVEKFLVRNETMKYPTCIDGELACPPDDCGGVWGYYQMLKVIQDKKHPDYEETIGWFGENFDAEHFDKNDVNEKLEPIANRPKSEKSNKKQAKGKYNNKA